MAFYDPDIPPEVPHALSDEFDDKVIGASWILPSVYSTVIDMYPSGTSVRINESDMEGFLLLQGKMIGPNLGPSAVPPYFSNTIQKDISSVSINQPFTVVMKHDSFPGYNSHSRICLGIKGQAENVFFIVGAGQYNSTQVGGTHSVYWRYGSAAYFYYYRIDSSGSRYLMIQYDGNKTFYGFGSYDGIGWWRLNQATISDWTSFTRLFIGNQCTLDNPTGITAIDFVRWFDSANVYLIGKSV